MCKKCNENLEKYKILYTAYADEIRNLWQRSIFLGAFMTLAWGGYGALQLKFITRKCGEFDMVTYCIASLGICATIMILSLLWIAMAKGSKFVQEAHEEHIKNLNYDLLYEIDIETNKLKRLFCDLNYYQEKLEKKDKLSFWNPLGTYRYSPSKINIALGWVSFVISFILISTHLLIMVDAIKQYAHSFILWITQYVQYENAFLIFICLCPFIFVIFITLLIHFTLKSNLGGGVARKGS